MKMSLYTPIQHYVLRFCLATYFADPWLNSNQNVVILPKE